MAEIKFHWPKETNEGEGSRKNHASEIDKILEIENLPILSLASLNINR